MYVDYSFYTSQYGGTLPPAVFSRLEIQASQTVNYYTFNRIGEPDDQIRYCVCELVEYLSSIENGIITSESVGKHSMSYKIEKSKDAMAKDIVIKWLLGTGLMYRGL